MGKVNNEIRALLSEHTHKDTLQGPAGKTVGAIESYACFALFM
jgi:hypothetical protein